MMTAIDAIGAKIERGIPLDQQDAAELLASPDLTALGMLAEAARQRRHGNRITFVRVASVSLSDPGGWEGPFPSSAGELRILGRPTDLDAAVACVRTVVGAAGRTPVSGFLLTDLEILSRERGIRPSDLFDRLREAGLQLVAEAPVNELQDPGASLDTLSSSGLPLARLTVSRATGSDRLEIIHKVQAIQTNAKIARAFAPLPRASSPLRPSTGYDDMKQVALGRLLLHDLPSIQVDWELHGAKLAQVSLMFGADDVDAVPAVDPENLGPRRTSLEEVRRNIRAASLEPVERNGRFEVVSR
jgi:aminodeoxyfutalosine synthase